jgi:hypothetical protein
LQFCSSNAATIMEFGSDANQIVTNGLNCRLR